jgi:hypothetical protein
MRTRQLQFVKLKKWAGEFGQISASATAAA